MTGYKDNDLSETVIRAEKQSPETTEKETLAVAKFIISGKVQGVWYRAWTQEAAKALGAKGFVRNRKDGSVEAIIRASDAVLNDFEKLFSQGSPMSKVEAVRREDLPADTQFDTPDDFLIYPTV